MSDGGHSTQVRAAHVMAGVVDGALEATVVGSFTWVGPAVRRRIAGWTPLSDGSAEGRTMVVTGATSGLGLQAGVELARMGANVCLVGRDATKLETALRKGEAAASTGRKRTHPTPVSVEQADLGDLNQVRRLVERLGNRFDRIDGLLHNAGALIAERQLSPQGNEITMAVHLLGPYVLTEGLLPLLSAAERARVITMTSGGMYTQRFDLGALGSGADAGADYRGSVAYARAKRAQVVLTREWQRRYGGAGIDFYVTHPGWADTPGLTAGLPMMAKVMRPLLRSPLDGVDTEVWLATSPEATDPGGGLWLDRRQRSEYHLPWTWVPPARRTAEGIALWEWCRGRTAE